MRLIRMTTVDPNCIFDETLHQDVTIAPNSSIALKNITLEADTRGGRASTVPSIVKSPSCRSNSSQPASRPRSQGDFSLRLSSTLQHHLS